MPEGILDTCSTPLGRKLLHTWHLRPLLDLVAINERHNAVAAFSSTDHQFQAKLMRGAMKKVGNIARVCTSLRRGRAQLRDWRALVDVSRNCALDWFWSTCSFQAGSERCK
jgi:DNA mismatch repair protein MSH5